MSMIAFNPQLAKFNLECGQKVNKLEVLVTHQFLEYFIAKCFIDEYVRFFEVREKHDIDFFGCSTDFDEVDYTTDIMKVTIKNLPLLVTTSKQTIFNLHGLWRLLSLEELNYVLWVARFVDKMVLFWDSSYTV